MPKERQRELIIQWSKGDQWFNYEDMAIEAAAALKKELSSIPEITNVELGGGEVLQMNPSYPARELILNVCAMLPDSSRLEQIPSVFAGFRAFP